MEGADIPLDTYTCNKVAEDDFTRMKTEPRFKSATSTANHLGACIKCFHSACQGFLLIYERKMPDTDQKFSEDWVAGVTHWLNTYNRVRDNPDKKVPLDPVENNSTINKVLWNEICSKWDPSQKLATVD